MSATTELPEVELVRAKAAADVAALDFERTLRRLVRSKRLTQSRVAPILGVSQARVSQKVAATTRSAPDVPEGFSGASPYEIAQRYAAGKINESRLVEELVRWPYTPREGLGGAADDLLVHRPGSFDEVGQAYDDGLIPGEVYDIVLEQAEHR